MAPLPPSNTERWKYTYQNSVAEHSVTFRLLDGSNTSQADSIMNAVMTYFDDLVHESTITSLEFADEGSDVFNLVTDSDLVGTSFGVGASNPTSNAVGATFIGRSSDGRRSRFTIFSWFGGHSDYRVTTTEDANLGILIDFLNAVSTPNVSISGGGIVFKPYIDIKANDHWVDEARG